MIKRIKYCILLLLLGFTHAKFNVEIGDVTLRIYYNDILLFEQLPHSPIFTLAIGESVFEENTGNFNINDTIIEEHGLDVFHIVEYNDTFLHANFSSNEVLDLQVLLSMNVEPIGNKEKLVFWTTHGLNVPEGYNRIRLSFYSDEQEKVYGGGEQYTYFNLRGHEFPIWTREQGVGRDGGVIANITDIAGAGGSYHTTYYPSAFYITSRLYAASMHNHNYLVLDFTDLERISINSHSTSISGDLWFGDSIIDILEQRNTWKKPLPEWITIGSILGLQEGTPQMLYYYELAKDSMVNISALWIQDWSGTTETLLGHRVYWNWKWNETYYLDLDEVIINLNKEGVRMTVYMNPYLIDGSEMFMEADALGFLMTDAEGNTFKQNFGGFDAGTVDLLYDEASAWYQDQIIQNVFNLGISGMMSDFGEYTRLDMFSRNSSLNQEEVHNLLPKAWAECNYAATKTANADDFVYWMRSGTEGAQATQSLAWAGDQNVDFSIADGVASTIIAALSLGLSGMPVTHFDIGGYTTQYPLTRSKELFLRSAEYSVFTPVMRTHEGNKPQQNHQFYTDEETLADFARLTQIHSLLSPYTLSLNEDALKGVPMQRPMFLHYEGDIEAWTLDLQYMYGRDLIVAPVIHRGQEKVDLYIPDGGGEAWFHLFTKFPQEAIVGPNWVEVTVPMGYPAVYFRESSEFQSLFLEIAEKYGM